MWFLIVGALFGSDVTRGETVPKYRPAENMSVGLWSSKDGQRYTTTADVAVVAKITCKQGTRPDAKLLSAKVVVYRPSKGKLVEYTSQPCRVHIRPQDEKDFSVLTTIKAGASWPPGDALVRVFVYDKSDKSVVLRASDTKFITFVVPSHNE